MRVYSVKRQGQHQPVKFTTPHSRRKSARFRGSLKVYVLRDEGVIEFRTGDYSETGMNLHARRRPNELLLQMGETINGYVSSPDHDMIRFDGQVVRIWQQGEGICYGIALHEAEQVPADPEEQTTPVD